MPRIVAHLNKGRTIHATLARGQTVGATVDKAREPLYEGSYIVTPSRQRQVLPSGHHNLMEDIVIEPIPSNYGLITWDGSVLTVS